MDAKLRSGEYQIHQFPLGFVISEIKQFEVERVLVVHLLLGERFDEWKEELVNHLRGFARQHGCAALEALCRLGLEKSLKPLGWKRARVGLRMPV